MFHVDQKMVEIINAIKKDNSILKQLSYGQLNDILQYLEEYKEFLLNNGGEN